MSGTLRRRFGVWAALAMIVTEVMGVGVFLTPAGMARTLNSTGWVLAVWALVGLLSVAGALVYAELGTRFPEAGGGYVFLREAFGERCAFVYGWMSLLVMDPGITAALGVGLAKYLLFLLGGSVTLVPAVAIVCIVGASVVSMLGVESSTRLLRWTALAKLTAVAILIVAAVMNRNSGAGPAIVVVAAPTVPVLAGALMGAFFAFGGWWDLGKMSEEIVEPRQTLPIALVGGILVVTFVYASVSLAFLHVVRGLGPASDEEAVAALGSALFGHGADKFLAAAVVIAVAGSLTAVLLGAPRVYLAMARSGVFPKRLVNFDARRQVAPPATLVQVVLACVLVLLGSFDQILGYFVPAAVFFLGLSAAAILILPRPPADPAIFRAPWHPLPIILFLVLVVVIVGLFTMGRPVPTLVGAAVIAFGIPVSFLVVKRPAASTSTASIPPTDSEGST
jgi:APA family basic amino acid/polyamine antiporter